MPKRSTIEIDEQLLARVAGLRRLDGPIDAIRFDLLDGTLWAVAIVRTAPPARLLGLGRMDQRRPRKPRRSGARRPSVSAVSGVAGAGRKAR